MRTRLSIVLVASLVVPGCAAAKPTPAPAPSPDVGGPVVLDARIPGWETSAWLAGEALCVRGARSGGKRVPGTENESTFCDPVPSQLGAAGSALLPAKPVPYLAPADPQSRRILLVGTVRGAIASVAVTMFGETATADVHALPATGGRRVGAYAVWLPASGTRGDGMNLDDITAVVARDAAGNEVTRLG